MNEFVEDERGLIGWKLTSNNKEEDVILYTEELIAVLLKFGR